MNGHAARAAMIHISQNNKNISRNDKKHCHA